jgi:cell division protein FtsX
MRLSSRMFSCLVGAVLAVLAFYFWNDHQAAALCARQQRVPCRVPADFLVLGSPVVVVAGALVGLMAEAVTHRWTTRSART